MAKIIRLDDYRRDRQREQHHDLNLWPLVPVVVTTAFWVSFLMALRELNK